MLDCLHIFFLFEKKREKKGKLMIGRENIISYLLVGFSLILENFSFVLMKKYNLNVFHAQAETLLLVMSYEEVTIKDF